MRENVSIFRVVNEYLVANKRLETVRRAVSTRIMIRTGHTDLINGDTPTHRRQNAVNVVRFEFLDVHGAWQVTDP